jgi:hypothetical protein
MSTESTRISKAFALDCRAVPRGQALHCVSDSDTSLLWQGRGLAAGPASYPAEPRLTVTSRLLLVA